MKYYIIQSIILKKYDNILPIEKNIESFQIMQFVIYQIFSVTFKLQNIMDDWFVYEKKTMFI